jgi:carbonic anhydrase
MRSPCGAQLRTTGHSRLEAAMTHFPDQLAERYRRFRFRHFGAHQQHFAELASQGQNPDVMIVSCSDSRVDPEQIFSALPGELFVVRNVANLVPPYETTGRYHGVSAALEFAVLNLRVRHIVVMGHGGCGGIKACLEHGAARQSEAEFISNWMSILDDARERIVREKVSAGTVEQAAKLEREAVKTSLANLRTFPCVATLEARGRLHLHGAHFDIASGELEVLNPVTDRFVTL